METRTFALISTLLAVTLSGCPALERLATDTPRMQAEGAGAGGDAAPTPGPATSPPATATPNIAAIYEADAGLEPGLTPDEADAGLEPGLMPDEADAGLDVGVTCRGQIVGDCAQCLQDDAFCEPLPDGRWCTGPSEPPILP